MGETIRIIEARAEGFTQALTIEAFGKTFRTHLPLLGAFQVENALVAEGLVLAVEGEGRAAEVFEGFKGLDRKSTTSELQSRQYLVCRLLLAKKQPKLKNIVDALP